MVKNKDGTVSNVLMMTFGMDTSKGPRTFIIPTMVNKMRLSAEEAMTVAKSYGLDRYPSFGTEKEANDFAKLNHGNISDSGWLLGK